MVGALKVLNGFTPFNPYHQLSHTFLNYPSRSKYGVTVTYERINIFKKFHGIFIPDGVWNLKGLSYAAKLLYGRLARYAGEDGRCFPKVKTLMYEFGVSRMTITRWRAELVEARLIQLAKPENNTLPWDVHFLNHPCLTPGVHSDDATPTSEVMLPPPQKCGDPHPKSDAAKESHSKENQVKESPAPNGVSAGTEEPHEQKKGKAKGGQSKSVPKKPTPSKTVNNQQLVTEALPPHLKSEKAPKKAAGVPSDFTSLLEVYPERLHSKVEIARTLWEKLTKADKVHVLESANTLASYYHKADTHQKFFPCLGNFMQGKQWEEPAEFWKARAESKTKQPQKLYDRMEGITEDDYSDSWFPDSKQKKG